MAITVGVLVIAAVLRDIIEIVQVIRVALFSPESLLLGSLIKVVCFRVRCWTPVHALKLELESIRASGIRVDVTVHHGIAWVELYCQVVYNLCVGLVRLSDFVKVIFVLFKRLSLSGSPLLHHLSFGVIVQ